VSSDIVMPDRYAYLKMGERVENAMPWDKIDPAEYAIGTKPLILTKQYQTVKAE
jgi:carboxyl-terminal processing protease